MVEQTGSTNADLMHIARTGTDWPDGVWLVARRQISGRGRLGRQWTSTEGNFHGSTLLRRAEHWPPLPSLSLISGLAAHDAVRALWPDAPATLQLKWPNDLMLDTAKLGGVLLETEGQHVVVGIGINLAVAPEVAGRRTTSMMQHGPAITPEQFAPVLADCFAVRLQQWVAGMDWRSAWEAAAHPRGTAITRVMADPAHGALTGRFDGLEQDGGLRLLDADGKLHLVHTGEIIAQR